MHAVLALTANHDRVLSSPDAQPTANELFHSYKATALFNYKLKSQYLTPSERDAIWMTSHLIGMMGLCNIQARAAEEAWPLKDRDPGEPDWLALNLGKNDMWDLCDPTRTDSCFKVLLVKCAIGVDDPDFTPCEVKDGGFHNLPREMIAYLHLDDALNWTGSPYFRAANIVSQLMLLEYNQTSILKFITFISLMQPEFQRLWMAKDPGVLLLLSYWYAKAIPLQQWWTWKRAVLECQAICIFLERYHVDIPHLERILRFPKQSCGLVTTLWSDLEPTAR